MITWEPWEYNTVDIKNGKADAYINQNGARYESLWQGNLVKTSS